MEDTFTRYQQTRLAYEETHERTLRDPMTCLYNRHYFYTVLAIRLAESTQTRQLSLIVCDIARFKSVNETWGHAQGDRVISRVAKVIHEGVREGDVVTRICGEEFAVILPGTSGVEAVVVAERVRLSLEKVTAGNSGGDFPAMVTMSFGVMSTVQKAMKASACVEFADKALYQAKRGGRNRVVIYDESLKTTN